MTKIDFYIIAETSLAAGLGFVCRLLDKAYQQKHHLYVQMNNETEAKMLDDLLWTFREDSFIPHGFVNQAALMPAPILIGFEQAPVHSNDILINLTQNTLACYQQFKRVIEIVPNETQAKEICRKKFRHYKEQGCELTTHDLTR
jgi:DNA polymerase-3 subunit chi